MPHIPVRHPLGAFALQMCKTGFLACFVELHQYWSGVRLSLHHKTKKTRHKDESFLFFIW